MTPARMGRYLTASGFNTRKAMTLYRKNLQLSQELFTVISCFEIDFRNSIDRHYTNTLGKNWLEASAAPGGIFDNQKCRLTRGIIDDATKKLGHTCSHFKLIAELGFGFWRYMFAQHQFAACGKTLMRILPGKPKSTSMVQYNQNFVFNQLAIINEVRNRIAHNEPVCFFPGNPIKNTEYARQHYNLVLQLFHWMDINESALLYGLDHINAVCNEIDDL